MITWCELTNIIKSTKFFSVFSLKQFDHQLHYKKGLLRLPVLCVVYAEPEETWSIYCVLHRACYGYQFDIFKGYENTKNKELSEVTKLLRTHTVKRNHGLQAVTRINRNPLFYLCKSAVAQRRVRSVKLSELTEKALNIDCFLGRCCHVYRTPAFTVKKHKEVERIFCHILFSISGQMKLSCWKIKINAWLF